MNVKLLTGSTVEPSVLALIMEIKLETILIAFVTGLTTGGLSCLAVQGGLLASSLSHQIENSVQQNRTPARGKNKQKSIKPQFAIPILVFLAGKLVAYSALGFLLGLLGQMFQLSILTRAILQILIGVFMLGTALRMLNVHPIFRYFVIEPPAFIRKKLRNTAANPNKADLSSPAFLGFLTVLIPCGVTQAMMAVALGSGDPLQGMALMFSFTLGASLVFFAVAYFTTQIGSKMEKHFMRFVAIVILVLAFVTIDNGISLAGSPVSISRLFKPSNQVQASVVTLPDENQAESVSPIQTNTSNATNQPEVEAASESSIISINVENYGYSPDVIHAKAGVPITLELITNNIYSCSRAFVIPSLRIERILPETGVETISLPAQEAGKKLQFSCSMGMYTGVIIFDL
jgi:sulfite exporter TauE/SafE